MTTTPNHSPSIVDTLVNFLDTCPDLEGTSVEFGPVVTKSDRSMVIVTIDGVEYLVNVVRSV